MCGVAALYAYGSQASNVQPTELMRIRDHMAARGPDGQGEWYSADGRVALGHRRLAIIDPDERANQPMASVDGVRLIVFNGEIYNFRQLRSGLQARGHAFRTESDSEVLLQLYAEKGEAMLGELRGMFAFALWDGARSRLLLARDAYGIKPLYFADDGGTLKVASQVKALLAGGSVDRELDPAGVAGFHLFGSVPEPFTLYRAIHHLPAGHYLLADSCGVGEPVAWSSIAGTWAMPRAVSPPPGEIQPVVREALLDTVRHHLVADVPVGAFLSAGIDSGALVGLMRDAGAQDIQTVTLAFDEFAGKPDDEAPLAAQVASRYGTRHVTRRVSRAEFEQDLPRILAAMDQPSIDGINSWFVSKAAAEQGLKVAVSGLGGDELFGGYPSFRDLPRWVRWLHGPAAVPGLGLAFRGLTAPLARLAGISPKAAGMLELGGDWAGAYLLRRGLFMPWELPALLGEDLAREGLARLQPLRLIKAAMEPAPPPGFARVAALEASLYMRNQLLRDADWAGMAHSLEIRVPLVDTVLLQKLAPLTANDADWGKQRLAAALGRPLGPEITARAKTGFVTPVAQWQSRHAAGARQGLRPWARSVFGTAAAQAVAHG